MRFSERAVRRPPIVRTVFARKAIAVCGLFNHTIQYTRLVCMKTLVAYYSRTGNTRKIAVELAAKLNADVEEIIDSKSRDGAMGYILAGRDSLFGRPAAIKQPSRDPSLYDLVVVGTPVWAFTVSAPVKTYLKQNQGKFKNVAFYLTCGSVGGRAFKEMEGASGREPAAVLEIREGDIKGGGCRQKLLEFTDVISKIR